MGRIFLLAVIFVIQGWFLPGFSPGVKPVAGSESTAAVKIVCEIIAGRDQLPEAVGQAILRLKKKFGHRLMVLLSEFDTIKNQGGGGDNVQQGPGPQTARLIINGRREIVPAREPDWQVALEEAIASEDQRSGWNLFLYFSTRLSRGGKPEINIDVCNLDPKRTFKGYYQIWLVTAVPGFDGALWRIRRIVGRKNLRLLPQESVQWCPFPDVHHLMHADIAHPHRIVVVVTDVDGHVQAAAQETSDITLTPSFSYLVD